MANKDPDSMEIYLASTALVAFASFAKKNRVNGQLIQTIGYFLGPAQKNGKKRLIDTIVIPEQKGTHDSVEDNGCEGKRHYYLYKRIA